MQTETEYIETLNKEYKENIRELKSIHDELIAKLPEAHYKQYAKTVARHIAKYQQINIEYIVNGVKMLAGILSNASYDTENDKNLVMDALAKLESMLALVNRK